MTYGQPQPQETEPAPARESPVLPMPEEVAAPYRSALRRLTDAAPARPAGLAAR